MVLLKSVSFFGGGCHVEIESTFSKKLFNTESDKYQCLVELIKPLWPPQASQIDLIQLLNNGND